MIGVEHLGWFVAAGVLLNLTPGPDVFYILSQSLRSGFRAGAVAALGIIGGCFVHIGAAAIGVTALVAASATLFGVLKIAGAAYLVYVGVLMTFSAQPRLSATAPPEAMPLRAIFWRGFLTNALNPKVALFFLAFVPQFIAPDAAHQALSFALLGLIFNFNSLFVNMGWAVAAAWLAANVGAVRRCLHWIERVAGVLFVGFGVRLALSNIRQG